MRHRKRGRKLGVTPSHRKAMGRNMVQALIDNERIVTTVEKAKQFQPLAEKAIHLGKLAFNAPEGTPEEKGHKLHLMRRCIELVGNRKLEAPITSTETAGEGKEKVVKTRTLARTTLQKLVQDIGKRNSKRDGGYTRIIRMARRRTGDNASQCILELTESPWTKVTKEKKKAEKKAE
ncbi:MAG: 50S ribosomal protein L17 [Planctomycetes bacterium]|nr:50S ribosomal protein L17 [Planctomycetota bacterium]MCW8136464.1 50S ribosomal protein L17 [Planctomycetota bacterium]